MDVHFPKVVYKKLINVATTLEDLHDVNPDLLDGLKKLLAYEGGDVEDVFGLTFQIAYDMYGERKTHDLKPGGGEISVTKANKQGTDDRHNYL